MSTSQLVTTHMHTAVEIKPTYVQNLQHNHNKTSAGLGNINRSHIGVPENSRPSESVTETLNIIMGLLKNACGKCMALGTADICDSCMNIIIMYRNTI